MEILIAIVVGVLAGIAGAVIGGTAIVKILLDKLEERLETRDIQKEADRQAEVDDLVWDGAILTQTIKAAATDLEASNDAETVSRVIYDLRRAL